MRNTHTFFIRLINFLIDVLFINTIFLWIDNDEFLNFTFLIYINFCWFLIAYLTKYYSVYRTTHFVRVFILYLTQLGVFFLAFFSYFTLFREGAVVNSQFIVFVIMALNTLTSKLLTYLFFRIYNKLRKKNKNVIVVGIDKSSKKLINFFKSEESFGYNFIGFFSNETSSSTELLGDLDSVSNYYNDKKIHEIYCSFSVTKDIIKKTRHFANKNRISFKMIPDSKDLYSKRFDIEYYGVLPVLRPRRLPFELIETHVLKRIFDIVFSLAVILIVLSWLVPLLFLIVKLDSKGPLFFYQKRSGINGSNFCCYKFRSMKVNNYSDNKQASVDDDRITKVGKFLRKTSIDEIPQFLNVFLGDMSVVGPRPHMNKQSLQFEKEVNNYIKRYEVKPGITGLAQISGYRGEIQKKSDIENRVRLDIFYIKNWSFFLDVKIIFQTVFNVFKGEEKAY